MDNPHVYSIWIQPTGEVCSELSDIISRLSREYSTPAFEPHITLLGELVGQEEELVSRTRQLAIQLHPYVVELEDVDGLDEFYRCLFVHIKETDPVMAANAQARKLFRRKSDGKYMPHLSLLYGDLKPTTKEEIKASLGKTIRWNFPVDRIHLVSTYGNTKDWYHLGEFTI